MSFGKRSWSLSGTFDWEFFVCHGRMASIEGELSNGHCSPLENSVLDNKLSFIECNSNKYMYTMSTEFSIWQSYHNSLAQRRPGAFSINF
jgi:hypothetical protein